VAVDATRDSKGKPLATIPLMGEEAPWMAVALSEAKKWAKNVESEIETNYHKETGTQFPNLVGDRRPWCASFVNYCLKKSTPAFSMSKSPASSQSFRWDKNFYKIKEKIYGAIVVFVKPNGNGHVGFVYNENTHIGGNQSDMICFNNTTSSKGLRLVGYYVPSVYKEYALKVIDEGNKLGTQTADDLNAEFGIRLKNKKGSAIL
jgi:uncharacterized protein (TIGR02594 family)